MGLQPEEAFVTEIKGDPSLLRERQTPRNKLAHYKQRFRQILGSSQDQDPGRRKGPPLRFFQKSYLRHFLQNDNVCDLSSSTNGKALPNDSVWRVNKIVLPVDRAANISANDEANPLKIYDMNTVAYIEGRSKDTASEDALDGQESESIKLHYVQEQTRVFNQKLRVDPYNESLWLEFVEFQDVSIQDAEFAEAAPRAGGDDEGSDKKVSKKKKASRNVILKQKALVEKKLSILKSAIEKNPKSIRLAVKRLELSRELLDATTLDRQWKELIFIFPRNFDLWHHYLNFVSSHFTNFTVSKIIKSYRACIQKLKQIQTQSFTSFDDKPDGLEDHMIRVLISLCNFLTRAGYREKSIALFQVGKQKFVFENIPIWR